MWLSNKNADLQNFFSNFAGMNMFLMQSFVLSNTNVWKESPLFCGEART